MSGKPVIPDQRELFCHCCQKHRPRNQIVEARWIRGGKQTVYRCRFCVDRLIKIKATGK